MKVRFSKIPFSPPPKEMSLLRDVFSVTVAGLPANEKGEAREAGQSAAREADAGNANAREDAAQSAQLRA